MPWALEERDGETLVVNRDTGKVMGRHPSRARATAQLRALYANVHKSSLFGWLQKFSVFHESEHPRHPAGSPQGGEFAAAPAAAAAAAAEAVKQLNRDFRTVPDLTARELQAVRAYQSHFYHLMNGALRSPNVDRHLRLRYGLARDATRDEAFFLAGAAPKAAEPGSPDYVMGEQYIRKITADITYLDQVLARMPRTTAPVTVWRSVAHDDWMGNTLEEREAYLAALQPGVVVQDKGFLSTTASRNQAERWSGLKRRDSTGTLFELRLPAGTQGGWMPRVDPEEQQEYIVKQEFLMPRGAKFRVVEVRDRGRHIVLEHVP